MGVKIIGTYPRFPDIRISTKDGVINDFVSFKLEK